MTEGQVYRILLNMHSVVFGKSSLVWLVWNFDMACPLLQILNSDAGLFNINL